MPALRDACFCVALGCCATHAIAQLGEAEKQAGASATSRDPYAGVVTDSTITLVGHEFYRSFVSQWRELSGTERFSIAVVERPSARWGSLVWVEFRQRRVYSAFLSPGRRQDVRPAAEQAVQVTFDSVVDTEVQRLLFRDPDLAREEL